MIRPIGLKTPVEGRHTQKGQSYLAFFNMVEPTVPPLPPPSKEWLQPGKAQLRHDCLLFEKRSSLREFRAVLKPEVRAVKIARAV